MKLLNLLFLLTSILIFSQKKEIYLDEEYKELTTEEFYDSDKPFEFILLKYDLDTIILNIKVEKIRKGKLPLKQLNSLKVKLSELSGAPLPLDNNMVINYHHGEDKCNASSNVGYVRDLYKKYIQEIKKMPEISQFFMYKSSEGTKRFGNKINWIEDKYSTIESLFFPLEYPCGSYVIIDNSGNYYIKKGEYYILEILELLKNPSSTFILNNK